MRTELSELAEKVYFSDGFSEVMKENKGLFYKIGCNFEEDLIDKISELNRKYNGKAKVKEFFGSDNWVDRDENGNEILRHGALTARPDWRIQSMNRDQFAAYVKKALDNGIVFNYTLNSIQPYGSKSEMMKHKNEIIEFVSWLESIGVFRVTVANPMMMMFVREASKTLRIEVSCIAHIDTVTQIKYYKEMFNIDKICCSILKNRNMKFLQNVSRYCNDNGITCEILANEFCGVAGVDGTGGAFATHCVFRDSCYLTHATSVTKEDSMAYNNYPMQFCMCARESTPESWLRMRWVRPEDQHYYTDLGINYFKVSGRTGSTEYLSSVIEAYMKEEFDDNLLALWKPLASIYNGKSENETGHVVNIPNKKLDGFLEKWFSGNGWECENEICGTTCRYCEEFTKNHIIN